MKTLDPVKLPAWAGRALVVAQFAALALIAVLALPALAGRAWTPGAWALLAAGVLVGVAALASNRPGNFNISPEPRRGGRLVRGGPYRWVRHPMYSALMLAAAAPVWAAPGWAINLAWAMLVAVLSLKASVEEAWQLQTYPDYAAYRERTRRFVPGLY